MSALSGINPNSVNTASLPTLRGSGANGKLWYDRAWKLLMDIGGEFMDVKSFHNESDANKEGRKLHNTLMQLRFLENWMGEDAAAKLRAANANAFDSLTNLKAQLEVSFKPADDHAKTLQHQLLGIKPRPEERVSRYLDRLQDFKRLHTPHISERDIMTQAMEAVDPNITVHLGRDGAKMKTYDEFLFWERKEQERREKEEKKYNKVLLMLPCSQGRREGGAP